MATKKTEKWRDRKHTLVLYPDCAEHCEAVEKIKKSYDYALILHDRDYYTAEDIKELDKKNKEHNHSVGELKKKHWHIILRFKQAVWNTALAKELGIEPNRIEQVRNMNNALEYLIHYNDNDKAQYNVDDVKGTLKDKLIQSINSSQKDESEKMIELMEHIGQQTEKITIKSFAMHCATQGYWGDFRRNASIIFRIIDEHNYRFEKKAEKKE